MNLVNQPFYARAVANNHGRAVPEARLPPMIIGGFLFTIGLFWFGWTAAPNIHWLSPVIAAGRCKHIVPFHLCVQCSRSHADRATSFHWSGFQHRVPAVHQLHRRHVRTLCSQRHGRKYLPALVACVWAPLGGTTDVLELGSRPCLKYFGQHLVPCSSYPGALHEIWSQVETDVKVCACSCGQRIIEFSCRASTR